MKNHSRNLHAPLCGIFCPNSVAVARYGALIRTKSSTNCDAHLAESLFQTRSRRKYCLGTDNSCKCFGSEGVNTAKASSYKNKTNSRTVLVRKAKLQPFKICGRGIFLTSILETVAPQQNPQINLYVR